MSKLCPICLKSQEEFVSHHVIWRANGGSDDRVNLLDVCRNCHAILTFGDSLSVAIYNNACKSIQRASFGLDFEIKAYKSESKRKSDILSDLDGMTDEQKDKHIRQSGWRITELVCQLFISL